MVATIVLRYGIQKVTLIAAILTLDVKLNSKVLNSWVKRWKQDG